MRCDDCSLGLVLRDVLQVIINYLLYFLECVDFVRDLKNVREKGFINFGFISNRKFVKWERVKLQEEILFLNF